MLGSSKPLGPRSSCLGNAVRLELPACSNWLQASTAYSRIPALLCATVLGCTMYESPMDLLLTTLFAQT